VTSTLACRTRPAAVSCATGSTGIAHLRGVQIAYPAAVMACQRLEDPEIVEHEDPA
jgi:hypothetical protein